MFRVKVCGVTTPEDAAHAVSCGADAVGINFFRGSPRRVDEGTARDIVRAVGNRAEVVAVFVNEVPDTVASLCARLGISRVQLHGEERPEDVANLPLWRLKAVHAGGLVDLGPLRTFPCEAFLVDAGSGREYGGTGRPLPWTTLRHRFGGLLAGPGEGRPGKPWVLAGGLSPENVERAIAEA